jgi:exosortase/archaeosortase family protein
LNWKEKISSIDRDQAFLISLILLVISATIFSHRTVADVIIGSSAFLALILLSEPPHGYSVSLIERLIGAFLILMGFIILPLGVFTSQSYAGLGFAEIGIAAIGVVFLFYGLKGIRTYGISLTFFFIYGLLTPMLTRIRYDFDYHFPWYNAFIARVVGGLVWIGGIDSEVQSNIIILNGKQGVLALEVLPICAGIDAMVIFGLLLVLLISHLRLTNKTKGISSFIGVFALIPLNLIRVTALVIIGYAYGLEIATFFHSHIGDVLFLVYVVAFFVLLSGYEVAADKKSEEISETPSE